MKPQAFANAFALLTAIVYVICAGWVVVSRSGFMALTGTWIHGIDMEALPFKTPTFGDLVIGFVTATAAAWVAAYLLGWFYKRFA